RTVRLDGAPEPCCEQQRRGEHDGFVHCASLDCCDEPDVRRRFHARTTPAPPPGPGSHGSCLLSLAQNSGQRASHPCAAAICSKIRKLVSRFRSLQYPSAHSDANFGIKRTLASLCS